MTARLERLLTCLAAWEEEAVQLSLDDLLTGLAKGSGYQVSTVQTFFAKGLDGHVVHGGSDGRYFVMGAVGMSVGDLATMLAAKLADGRGIGSRDEWCAALRRLAEIGLVRGYRLDSKDAELVLDATDAAIAAPASGAASR